MSNGMNVGFNIIKKSNYKNEIFKDKISIINFLKAVLKEEKLPYNIAVLGLEALLYYAEEPDEISKYVRNLLQDHANYLVRGNFIVQIVIEGDLEIIESSERPRIRYKDKKLLLYPIFGRVKQVDLKHFIAPLNLQS